MTVLALFLGINERERKRKREREKDIERERDRERERERERERGRGARDAETVEAAYSNQARPKRGVITTSSLIWPLYNARQTLILVIKKPK